MFEQADEAVVAGGWKVAGEPFDGVCDARRETFRFEPPAGVAFRLPEGGGYARIDLRMDATGRLYVLEANPNPQIAYQEDFADSAEKARYTYKDLLQELVNVGLRWQPAKAA